MKDKDQGCHSVNLTCLCQRKLAGREQNLQKRGRINIAYYVSPKQPVSAIAGYLTGVLHTQLLLVNSTEKLHRQHCEHTSRLWNVMMTKGPMLTNAPVPRQLQCSHELRE